MSTEKIKLSQKEFDELYEIDKPIEKPKEKEEEILTEDEQAFDDKTEDMLEWGQ